MKNLFTLSVLIAALCFAKYSYSQTSASPTVLMMAQAQKAPKQIKLYWVAEPSATRYQIFRKTQLANDWGTAVATINSASINEWVDTSVAIGSTYEYKITRTSTINGVGYLFAGIEAAPIENRGKLILLVDNTVKDSLVAELQQLRQDLISDGWQVVRRDVPRNMRVDSVKNIIMDIYNADPNNTRSVFLFGHVPVPYSGDIYPDGHPDHRGAWPADVYYGDMDGSWPDFSVNVSSATRAQNKNIPFDWKFDPSYIYQNNEVELEVGRVDLSNMPVIKKTEIQLLKSYLQKDHNFRMKNFVPANRGLIDDNFGYFGGEAFASSGYRTFAPFFGASQINAVDYFGTLNNNTYLWAYGCGGGSYTSCGGVGTTNQFDTIQIQSVFNMLFGSYFGDWDVTNSFLRGPLASGTALTNAWSGRPYFHFYHMSMGENIGYSTKVSQNNYTTYVYNAFPTYIHMALMGDPTLRLHYVKPASSIALTKINSDTRVQINWTATTDTVLGYYVYRTRNIDQPFQRISSLIAGTQFVDSFPKNVRNIYMVRAVKLQTDSSGSYYNLSHGIIDSTTLILSGLTYTDEIKSMKVYPSPASNTLHVDASFEIVTGGLANISITDLQGREVLTTIEKVEQLDQNFMVNINHLNNGIYLLRLQTESGHSIQKFIIQR